MRPALAERRCACAHALDAAPPLAPQAELLWAVDQTRGDLIAACRHCAKFVGPCAPLVSEVHAFCEMTGDDDASPRELEGAWRAAAGARASTASLQLK